MRDSAPLAANSPLTLSACLFQAICREVDARREAVKWLVQTLDALTVTRSDSEALEEQRLLEELIARYKNLIPSIEMTVVRTELYSKCYVYTKEVKEVSALLHSARCAPLRARAESL